MLPESILEPFTPENMTVRHGAGAGRWERRCPLPLAVSEVGAAVLHRKVHVIGGTDQAGIATTFHVSYDPLRDVWEERAPLPGAIHHVGVTELDGGIYAVGGLTENVHLGPKASVLVYDPKVDDWSELAPLALPRGSVAVTAVAGKVHAFGGATAERVVTLIQEGAPEMRVGTGSTRDHDVYDPAGDRWQRAEPLPGPPRDHAGIAVLHGQIHVFGGRITDYSDMLDRHDVFDPETGTWTSAAPLPRPRSAGAFTVLDGRIIYAGGECKPGGVPFSPNTFDDVDAYDPSTGTWIPVAPLPQARHAFGAATIDGVAYLAGGAVVCGGGASTDLFAFSLA
jgi:N-acetylneuraminic acid mutarotase